MGFRRSEKIHQIFKYIKYIDCSQILSPFENMSLSFEILVQCALWKEVSVRSS